jgi:hypothetical protein
MNVRLFTKCSHCWASRNLTFGSCGHSFEPRIEWDPIPDCITIVRVTYRFIAERYQKDYIVHGRTFPLVNLFDIIGAVTGIQLIFRYINPFLLVQKDSNPIFLSEEQLYQVRDFLGSKSYLYGENSAF